jgi:hypothetical protein
VDASDNIETSDRRTRVIDEKRAMSARQRNEERMRPLSIIYRPSDHRSGGVGLFHIAKRPLEVLDPIESQADWNVRVTELERKGTVNSRSRERREKWFKERVSHKMQIRFQSANLSFENAAARHFGELRLQEESLLQQELLSREEMAKGDDIPHHKWSLFFLFLFCRRRRRTVP